MRRTNNRCGRAVCILVERLLRDGSTSSPLLAAFPSISVDRRNTRKRSCQEQLVSLV
jgi:hypothetical protein